MKISGNLGNLSSNENAREKFVKTNEDVCLLLFDGMMENLDIKRKNEGTTRFDQVDGMFPRRYLSLRLKAELRALFQSPSNFQNGR